MNSKLTQDRLRSLLSYNSDTGIFIWISSGKRAGWDDGAGYRKIKINGRCYRSHRLAWLYVYGEWPELDIDHIDGDRSNNRISNLRCATRSENGQNRKINKNSTSGMTGVSWHIKTAKWRAYITVMGNKVFLGYFDDLQSAKYAYLKAKSKLHKFQPVLRDGLNA